MPLIELPFLEPSPLPPRPAPLPQIDRRAVSLARVPPFPKPWFRECTPCILVVTDSLNFSASASFGLTEFVSTLRGSTIHGMTPKVVTALFDPNPAVALSYDAPTQHITGFKFTDASHGLKIGRYDVVFLLGARLETQAKLTDEVGALDAAVAFMQAGGGVFATGDHEDLGAGLCMDIPRVKHMRYWKNADTPNGSNTTRLTTSLPGSNDVYEFADQSDQLPQRLFVNYATRLASSGFAHPLLQLPGVTRAIEVFPDHPHEGECVVPKDLSTKLPDGVTAEWPAVSGLAHPPEMVALTMSHGNAFPGKAAVVPRSFIAVCAYEGHAANVGRVVTDATWHHFVNINIKPGMSLLAGRNLDDIHQYYVNLATWLMPKKTRRCRAFPWLLSDLLQYPLFEELNPPKGPLGGAELARIGALVEASLLAKSTRADVEELLRDGVEEALGTDSAQKLEARAQEIASPAYRQVARAALGALTLAAAERFNQVRDKQDLNGEQVFLELRPKALSHGARAYLATFRENLAKVSAHVDGMIKDARSD